VGYKILIAMRIAILFICIVITTPLFSQDYLYKKDGSVLPVRIIQSNFTSITYKLFDNQEGYSHHISNSIVDSIVFEDGKTIRIKHSSRIANINKHKTLSYPKHNILFLDLIDLAYRYNFGLGYEFLFHKPQIGFAFSFSKNLIKKDIPEYYSSGIYYPFMQPNNSIKVGINLYFINIKPFSYGIGAAYRIIEFDKYYDIYPPINGSYWQIKPTDYKSFAFMFFGKYYFTNFLNTTFAIDVHFKDHYNDVYTIPLIYIFRLDFGVNF
jgi:hypothetical protein